VKGGTWDELEYSSSPQIHEHGKIESSQASFAVPRVFGFNVKSEIRNLKWSFYVEQ
jgi:hypothetical protein